MFISPAVHAVLGYTPEEVYRLGGRRIWLESLHPDDVPRLKEAFDRLFAKNQPYDVECRLRRRDGQWVWIHDRAIATYEKDGVKLADGLMSDITGRKRAEEALQAKEAEMEASERRYRLLAENASDVIWTADLELRRTYVSPSVTRDPRLRAGRARGEARLHLRETRGGRRRAEGPRGGIDR